MLMMAVNRHRDVFQYFITSSDALFRSLFGQLFAQAMWSPTRLHAALGGSWACTGGGRAARPGMFPAYAAWSALEIELQALATLATLAQARDGAGAGYACSARPDLHTVCRSFPKISSALVQKFAADRDRQRSSFKPFRTVAA